MNAEMATIATYHEGGIHEVCGLYRSFDDAVKHVDESFNHPWGEWETISKKTPRSAVYRMGENVEIWLEEWPIRESE